MPADGGIRFGSYVLQRRIARGGMAEVFLAQHRDVGADRRVAVKRILPHHADTPDFIQMFLGEAKLAAQLSHPNIVPIYDFGKVDSDYFIAMEYVEGVHAGDVIRHGAADRMPPSLIARIGADAASALHYVHALRGPGGTPYGLVHRDVSPANLMLSFDGVAKLCDFGIAKAVALGNRPLTQAGLVRGKYAYMSPEQTVGAPLDGRSDVYTLSIVLWELAVGRTLVPRGDAVAAMRAIRGGKLQPIEQAAPETPAALAEAIRWGLTTAREQRPTAAQLAQVLHAFIVSSREPATHVQLGAWLRARFPQATTDSLVEMPARTQETPSTFSEPLAAGSPNSAQTPVVRDTARVDAQIPIARDTARVDAEVPVIRDTARVEAPRIEAPRLEPPRIDPPRIDPAAAPTLIATSDQLPPAALVPPAMPPEPAADTVPPAVAAFDNAETLMRSGAFRLPVSSAPSAIPTLIDGHGGMRGGPMLGMPVPPPQQQFTPPPPLAPLPPPSLRTGRMAAAMAGVALLSFAIVMAVRGTPREAIGSGAIGAQEENAPPANAPPANAPPANAPPANAPPANAAPTAPAAAQSPEPAVPTAPPPAAPPPAAPPTPASPTPAAPTAAASASKAILDVHTTPAGATVMIRRCREVQGKCSVDRAAVETPIGDCPASPCTFTLPIASYEVVVERDGIRERRTVALMTDVATSLDILLQAGPPPRRAATGKLTVRAMRSCTLQLDGRARPSPITELELRPGAHRLELHCGRRPATTRSVTIAAGKTTTLDFTR